MKERKSLYCNLKVYLQVFIINIIDTNNNAPQFRPSDNYIYKVAPPLPPGFLVTDCVNNLIVRDIDLTTQRIYFEIEENPFFEIVADTSTTPKEFKATLRTTTFIRRISEPIILWIKATVNIKLLFIKIKYMNDLKLTFLSLSTRMLILPVILQSRATQQYV